METDFKTFFSAKLKEKGLTLKKLSEVSGIALKHLENLNSGNFEALPATPYVRGYLQRISEILEFNPAPWWQSLKREEDIARSGNEDALPKNRFVKKSPAKKIWIVILILIPLLYFGIRFSKIFGRPEITVAYPPSEAIVSVPTGEITLQGNLKGGDKVMLNGEAIPLNEDGSWQKGLLLTPGLNTIEITAKKFLGRETKIIRQVIYEPPLENGKKIILPASTSTSTSTTP